MATLPIPEHLRKRLIELVRKNLYTFAASITDLGHSSVDIHTIKTGEAHPFSHLLRVIPFAYRQYLEQ